MTPSRLVGIAIAMVGIGFILSLTVIFNLVPDATQLRTQTVRDQQCYFDLCVKIGRACKAPIRPVACTDPKCNGGPCQAAASSPTPQSSSSEAKSVSTTPSVEPAPLPTTVTSDSPTSNNNTTPSVTIVAPTEPSLRSIPVVESPVAPPRNSPSQPSPVLRVDTPSPPTRAASPGPLVHNESWWQRFQTTLQSTWSKIRNWRGIYNN